MSWTYDEDPANEPRDELRFLIGDTTKREGSLTDAEVLYLINTHETVRAAAASAADAMAARYLEMSKLDKTVDDLKIVKDYEQTSARYTELAHRLRSGGNSGFIGLPVWADTKDNVFWIGMGDSDGSTWGGSTGRVT